MSFNLTVLFFIICFFNIINTSNDIKNLSNINIGKNLRKYKTKRNIQYESDSSEIISINYYITIFELYSFHDNKLDLLIFYSPQIKENISFSLSLQVRIINETGNYNEDPKFDIILNSKNTSNIYTLNLENLNII